MNSNHTVFGFDLQEALIQNVETFKPQIVFIKESFQLSYTDVFTLTVDGENSHTLVNIITELYQKFISWNRENVIPFIGNVDLGFVDEKRFIEINKQIANAIKGYELINNIKLQDYILGFFGFSDRFIMLPDDLQKEILEVFNKFSLPLDMEEIQLYKIQSDNSITIETSRDPGNRKETVRILKEIRDRVYEFVGDKHYAFLIPSHRNVFSSDVKNFILNDYSVLSKVEFRFTPLYEDDNNVSSNSSTLDCFVIVVNDDCMGSVKLDIPQPK